jgi:ribose transport system substrate-binding protein
MLVALFALGIALVVAGCGSSSDSTSSTASGASESSGSGAGGDPQALEAAQKGPTEWEGPAEAVTPPKQFNLALVTCDNASQGCLAPAEAAEAAAKLLGWDTTLYDGESDPTVQAKRVEQAIADNADGIITESVDGRGIGQALKDAKAAGIPVISTSNAAAPGEQGYQVDISPNFEQLGKDIANWVIVDSNEGAVLETYVDKEYQSTISTNEGILEGMKACEGCTTRPPVNFVAADLAEKLGPETVANLRANPDVNYIHFAYDPAATFQVPAILQAGLGDQVKGSSIIGDEQNLEFIADGQVQAADAVWDNEYQGYASVDQLIRLATGKPPAVSAGVPERFKFNENLPSVLLTKENLPDGGLYEAPFDYASEYEKLWGIG